MLNPSFAKGSSLIKVPFINHAEVPSSGAVTVHCQNPLNLNPLLFHQCLSNLSSNLQQSCAPTRQSTQLESDCKITDHQLGLPFATQTSYLASITSNNTRSIGFIEVVWLLCLEDIKNKVSCAIKQNWKLHFNRISRSVGYVRKSVLSQQIWLCIRICLYTSWIIVQHSHFFNVPSLDPTQIDTLTWGPDNNLIDGASSFRDARLSK